MTNADLSDYYLSDCLHALACVLRVSSHIRLLSHVYHPITYLPPLNSSLPSDSHTLSRVFVPKTTLRKLDAWPKSNVLFFVNQII